MTELALIAPEEHVRSKLLGGSDIASVLGISPWRTPLALWRDKVTPRVEDANPKRALTRGVRWESVVAEMLTESLERDGHKVEIVARNRRYRDETYDFMAAEIDYEVRLDGADEITNVELKTVHPFKMKEWGESGGDDLPVHYMAQVMWGLGVTRRRSGLLAALFGADELRAYPVAADDETIAAMRDRAATFWTDCVLTKTAPPPSTLNDLDGMFPSGSDRLPVLADDVITADLMRLRAVTAEIRAREAEADAIEFRVKQAMRDATELQLGNGKVAATWKERSGSWIDEAALKKAEPKLCKEFTRTWKKRVFTLKPFSTEGLQS